MGLLEERRTSANRRLSELTDQVAAAIDVGPGCVSIFVTGSYGRGEATQFSDVDFFVVCSADDGVVDSADAENVKRHVDTVIARQSIPHDSGTDAHRLIHGIDALIQGIGRPEDDHDNTLTCRLLLLLESRPLFDQDGYKEIVERVLRAYWRDFEDHRGDFVPGYLANDILRLWRTFCVNYEARTKSDPEEKKARRSLKNYKLKHSRLLTCYSALAHLLMDYNERQTVTIDDARGMVILSPTERIDAIGQRVTAASAYAGQIREMYEEFLSITDSTESDLVARFLDPSKRKHLMSQASGLGDAVYDLMCALRRDSRLDRLLVV